MLSCERRVIESPPKKLRAFNKDTPKPTPARWTKFARFPVHGNCSLTYRRRECRGPSRTSGRLESARPTLETLGVGSDVVVITRDLVPHAKPDPDLFLTAAERLNVDISASIVVGDSVWDLLAARRARALGIGLLSGGYGQDELERAGAYRVYQDPADLLKHLDEVGIRTAQ
jgi:hypothetical protein